MKKYLDATDKINSIRLELRHPNCNTIWVLVEGESDCKIYRKLLSALHVSVEEVQGGIENLRKAVETLDKETDRVLGIRDADFLVLNGKLETIENLFVIDCYDIELMMIDSDQTFMSLIAEFCKEHLLDYQSFRAKVLNSIKFLGGIRWYNDIKNLELNFKGLSIGSFFNGSTFQLDMTTCVQEINKRSPNKKVAINSRDIQDLVKDVIDLKNLCCGHDVIKVIVLYIASSQAGVSEKTVSSCLRTAYSIESFMETKLYRNLKLWESKHNTILFSDPYTREAASTSINN